MKSFWRKLWISDEPFVSVIRIAFFLWMIILFSGWLRYEFIEAFWGVK